MDTPLYKNEYPRNEPALNYRGGSPEYREIKKVLKEMENARIEVPAIIGGKEYFSGNTETMIMPHDHRHILGSYHKASVDQVRLAVETALDAKREWLEFNDKQRRSINLKAAELITEKYRFILNAATMLNQGKNVYQAEIDAACEMADFFRFNSFFMKQIYSDQPLQEVGIRNKLEYRPLEGFVYAISPFNFTSIAGNLAAAPALMGNTAVWKPASTSVLSGYFLMKLFQEAGYPDGVINFLPGSGQGISGIILENPDLAGIHFTGSTGVFKSLWKKIGENLDKYRTYPRLVGETGGKNFIIMHLSADLDEVATAIIRGGFEYQGQKCSAASRVYLPEGSWPAMKIKLLDMIREIRIGDPRDFSNFMNAVIDEASFDSIMGYIDHAKMSPDAEVITGGNGDKSTGYFIEPTVILTTDPRFRTMREEIFGPVVTIFLYGDSDEEFDEVMDICDNTSPYALTGSIFAADSDIIQRASERLRFTAGNFYINDKPTGAVVGQQPFGGGRASGTNDKAGSHLNLHRWVSPRTIKQNLNPPKDFRYPFMENQTG